MPKCCAATIMWGQHKQNQWPPSKLTIGKFIVASLSYFLCDAATVLQRSEVSEVCDEDDRSNGTRLFASRIGKRTGAWMKIVIGDGCATVKRLRQHSASSQLATRH